MLSVSTVASRAIKTSSPRVPLVMGLVLESVPCCYVSGWGRDERGRGRFAAMARIVPLFLQCISDGSQIASWEVVVRG